MLKPTILPAANRVLVLSPRCGRLLFRLPGPHQRFLVADQIEREPAA